VANVNISLVGLGKMGAPLAGRILDAGFALAVWNRTRDRTEPFVERGASVLERPGEALQRADVCITMLADDTALEEVASEVLEGAAPGTTLIDMSTVSVSASERVAGTAERAGVDYLRSPVSGNPGVVESGNLTMIVSGREQVVAQVRPLLDALGSKLLYVGEGERARMAKLVLQILVGGTAELLSEALVFGEAGGIERERLAEVINASVIGSAFIGYKLEPALRDDYSATFTTAMMIKDIDLVLERALETGVTLPFTQELRVLLDETAEGGYADADFMALYAHRRNGGTR
jgi:3-hydroxyisobutyrate dehydrogenase-like beta-hydroxyacid dehydrogenase